MQFPVDLLQTFVVLEKTKNFTAAGKQIHRSQSAVSMQIKRLTEIVGSPLLDTAGKRIFLTPMGELVLEHAKKILKAHEAAAIAISRTGLKGKIRFGAPEDYASMFIPRILAGFAQEYPDIRVDVHCLPSRQLYFHLLENKLDLAICTALDMEGEEELCREPVVWITKMDAGSLASGSVPLAVYGHDCIYRRWAIEALETKTRSFHIAYMSPSIAGILAAVRSSLAVAPVGRHVVPDDVRIIGPAEGFPSLPVAGVCLHRAANARDVIIHKLAAHVRNSFMATVSRKDVKEARPI
jgi:DNA-binding transcriptional LysR family regulator